MSRTKCDYSKALQFWWQSRKSRRPSFCRDLVRSFPGVFNFPGRSHPTLVAAATGKTLELSRAASKYPCALDGDLSAGGGDPAFKSAEVAVPVGMLIDEVAALRTVASDHVDKRVPLPTPFPLQPDAREEMNQVRKSNPARKGVP